MKNVISAFVLLTGLSAVAALPQVTDVSYTQGSRRVVTITYSLDSDAIVTADVLVDGVSVGLTALTNMTGDVNRLVKGGAGARTIRWDVRAALPDHEDIKTDSVRVKLTAWPTTNPPDVMVLDIEPDSEKRGPVGYYVDVAALPGGLFAGVYRESKVVLKRIHATGHPFVAGAEQSVGGTSDMGTTYAADVTLTNDYYIGVFELTQQQNYLLTGDGPKTWAWNGDGHPHPEWHPISSMSWNSLTTIHLPVIRERTGIAVSMPTETQWEFAANGGYPTGFWPSNGKVYNRYAMNDPNCEAKTAGTDGRNTGATICGSYPPNRYGLYDMIGNQTEICLDAYVENPTVAPGFEHGAAYQDADNENCVAKGGCFNFWEYGCFTWKRESMSKANTSYYYGFRVAAPIPAELPATPAP